MLNFNELDKSDYREREVFYENRKIRKRIFCCNWKRGEGSTSDGIGFIQRLWDNANFHFGEVQHLAKKDENGNIRGIWGSYVLFFTFF